MSSHNGLQETTMGLEKKNMIGFQSIFSMTVAWKGKHYAWFSVNVFNNDSLARTTVCLVFSRCF